jgi:hypothetical protein
MNMLTFAEFEGAQTFIAAQARPLEQARFAHYFTHGAAEAVRDALAAFQNEDGGFGHGLEPDLQTPLSSVLATTVALQLLTELATPAGHPLVQGALRYLLHTYDPEHALWPIRPDNAGNAPCAPWWQYPWDTETLHLNPRAEILGCLYRYSDLVPAALRQVVGESLLEDLETADIPIDMHALLCLLRLADAPGLPPTLRAVVEQRLEQAIPQTVVRDPAQWGGYGLKPLQVAPAPDARFAALLAADAARQLDYELEQQQVDGSWTPAWSWGDAYPEAWPAARRAWQGILTVNMLKTLRDYGRVA